MSFQIPRGFARRMVEVHGAAFLASLGIVLAAQGPSAWPDGRRIGDRHEEDTALSGTHLSLIPTDPTFIPTPEAQRAAVALLAAALPDAQELYAGQTPGVQFIDQGGNFDSVACPTCGAALDVVWWQQAMDHAWDGKQFGDLIVDLPCCGVRSSLNDLIYDMPAGFARFTLKVREPGGDIEPGTVAAIEDALGSRLRMIWARY